MYIEQYISEKIHMDYVLISLLKVYCTLCVYLTRSSKHQDCKTFLLLN